MKIKQKLASIRSLRVVGIYLLVSALWIYFSDSFLGMVFSDPQVITRIAIYKGTFYIIASGLLIYFLLENAFQKEDQIKQDLKKSENELRQLNLDLEKRITESTQEVQRTNKELEAFVYSVSHDLRAPLRHIDGYARALLEDNGPQLNPESIEFINRIQTSTTRMSGLVSSLLSLSRVAQYNLVPLSTDLVPIARRILDALHNREPDRKIDVILPEQLVVFADYRLMTTLLENLLENAWKFSSKTALPQIELGTKGIDQGLIICYVRDNGAGFDMAQVDRLFTAFQRLHSETEFSGSGIGLATVQRIVFRHGGRVWAEGQPDHGATVYFSLPVSESDT